MDLRITLSDLINSVDDIANCEYQIPILRLPNDNYFNIGKNRYELRIFAFYLPKPIEGVKTFKDFIEFKEIGNQEFKLYQNLRHIKPLSYNLIDDDIYLNISILPVIN